MRDLGLRAPLALCDACFRALLEVRVNRQPLPLSQILDDVRRPAPGHGWPGRHTEHVTRNSERTTRNNARPPAAAPTAPCPCGLDASYRDCCGRLHSGEAAAPTAERLMRSRFSAFAVRDAAYLLRTWHSTTRPADIAFEPKQQWTRLEILGATGGSAFHTEGTVEFRAHYRLRGHEDSQHELSRFVREDGLWVYLGEA